MNWNWFVLLPVTLLVALLSGCSQPPSAPSPTPEPAAAPTGAPTGAAAAREGSRVVAYRCDGGLEVVAEFEEDGSSVWLFLPGDSAELPRAEGDGGAVYSDGSVTFRAAGDRAWLALQGEAFTCREDRRRSVMEGVKLRGGDFWATGNEPGWTLELYPGLAVLVTDYGTERYEIPVEPPEEDRRAKTATFRGTAGGHELVVVLSGNGPCLDTMADGEVYETHVTVILDGTTLTGCGTALH